MHFCWFGFFKFLLVTGQFGNAFSHGQKQTKNRQSPNLNENFNIWIWDSDLLHDVMVKYRDKFNQDIPKLSAGVSPVSNFGHKQGSSALNTKCYSLTWKTLKYGIIH